MGVSIDTSGIMHDVVVSTTHDVTEVSAAKAASLLTSIDVPQNVSIERSGYTTPPPPTQAPARLRTMQATYSDISDDASDIVDGPTPATSTPLLTSEMLQRSTNILKRVHMDTQSAQVCNSFIKLLLLLLLSL